MYKTKVRNIENSAGREVVNQFIITTPEGLYFQSYDSVIAFMPYDNVNVKIDRNKWDYSTTTGKYRNIFLGEKKNETQRKIDEGIYELVNLN